MPPPQTTRTWQNSGARSGRYRRRTANFPGVSARWRPSGGTRPAAAHERPAPAATAAKSAPAVGSPPVVLPSPDLSETAKKPLDVRVKELEIGWAAQENATRQIIQDSLSKTGSKINNFLSLSGAVELLASRSGDFNRRLTLRTVDLDILSTAELDFDIRLSNWVKGSLVLNYDRGTGEIFPTGNVVPTGTLNTGVDRFTLDRSHIVIGDLTQFPIAARFGLEVLPFGTSTGVARLDTLSIGTPLTTEVFENRQTAARPSVRLANPAAAAAAGACRRSTGSAVGLRPTGGRSLRDGSATHPLPQLPVPPEPVRPPIDPPPFYGSIMVYKGSEEISLQPHRSFRNSMPVSATGRLATAACRMTSCGHRWFVHGPLTSM